MSWNSTSKLDVYSAEELEHLWRRKPAGMGYQYYNSSRDSWESPTSLAWFPESEAHRYIKARRNKPVELLP